MRFPIIASAVLLGLQTLAHGQSITLTSPTVEQSIYEGDDYATHVLQDPWDGNYRRDFGWEENLVDSGSNRVRSENGIIKAQFSTVNGYFLPLFQGFTSSIKAEGLPGDRTLPHFGRNSPVPAWKYNYLSYRLNLSARSVGSVSWAKTTQTSNGGWPTERGAYLDGYYGYTQGFNRSGWHTYMFNMADLNATFGAGLYSGSWDGNISALRIEPSSTSPAGTQLDVDWIRLVDPTSAPELNITWNSSGVDSISDRVISVAYTTNPADRSAGAAIQQFGKVDPHQFRFPLAALPPGDYYFFVFAHPPGNHGTVLAQSALSSRVRIQAAPTAYFTSPIQTSGQEYATSVVGNPWDMAAADDIENLKLDLWPDIWRQFSSYDLSNGNFNATADGPVPGAPHSDVQVHMNVSPSNPIDTNKYRYITYKILVDESQHATMTDKVSDGWVMRVVGWNHTALGVPPAGSTSFLPAAHVLYEGDHVYTYDLWDESAEALDLGGTWKSNPWIYHFRVDPLEVIKPTRFSLDYVQLNAEPRPDSNGIYPVAFTLEGEGEHDVSVFYDTDNTGFNGTLISTLTRKSAGSYEVNWNTTGLPANQRYYIYLVISHGSGTRGLYSPVPIIIGQYSDPTPPPLSEAPIARLGPGITFTKITMSPKTAKVGKMVTFSADITSEARLQSVTVELSEGKKTIRTSLKYQSGTTYTGTWKAKLSSSKAKSSRFRVRVVAKTIFNESARGSGGSISVKKK